MILFFPLFTHAGEAMSTSTVYKNTNDGIEKMTHQIEIFCSRVVTPLFIFPMMFTSYFQYYVKDAGEASFRLSALAT